MGRKKKEKVVSRKLEDNEKVGFNQQIPDVTIILTEHSMDYKIVQRLIEECQSSLFYHKFIIRGYKNHTRGYILKAIMDFVHPTMFMPVHFNTTGGGESSYFLARNCLDVIMKIIANKFTVPHPMDPENPLKIIIFANCMVAEDVHVTDTTRNISEVMDKRFNPATKNLNLNRFSNDNDLVNYCPLFNEKILQHIMMQAAKLCPVSVDLGYNNIKDITPIRALKDCVQILDLSYNHISDISNLKVLTEFKKLKSLRVTNNPFCEKYNTYDYVFDVKNYCPSVKQLDGVHLGIPDFKKNFLCTPEAAEFAEKFLEHFFTVYDSPRRKELIYLYHDRAIFSVTSKIVPAQRNCNSVILDHYGLKKKLSVYGINAVLTLFESFPATTHDPYPMVCDVTMYTDTHAQIIVSGIFKELKQVLMFSRHFYLKRMRDQFLIINEQLHVSNALSSQLNWSFAYPPSVKYTGYPVPYYIGQYREVEQVLQQLTGMNTEYCQKYLVYCNYELKKALTLFSELHVNGEVPKEAFEPDLYIPPPIKKNEQMALCDGLRKKVFAKHPVMTLKTLWETLNEERLECSGDWSSNTHSTIKSVGDSSSNKLSTAPSKSATGIQRLSVGKTFLERETEKLKEANLIAAVPSKPAAQLQPPPAKKAKDDGVPLAKSNPLLHLANRMAQNKELVLKNVDSTNQQSTAKQPAIGVYVPFIKPQISTSFTLPPPHLRAVVPPVTLLTGAQVPRPTASSFFNQQPPTKEMPTIVPKPSIDQTKITGPAPQLGGSDTKPAEKSNKGTSAATLLKINAISKMRENLQEEKRRLLELREKIDTKEVVKNIVNTQPHALQNRQNLVQVKTSVQNPPVANIISNILLNQPSTNVDGSKPTPKIETTDFIKILEEKKKLLQAATMKQTPAVQDTVSKQIPPAEKSILGKHPLQVLKELEEMKRPKIEEENKKKVEIPVITDVVGPDDTIVYDFLIHHTFVGRLIGTKKFFITLITSATKVTIDIKINENNPTWKICSISGTKAQTEAALRMIRDKFPLAKCPNLTLNRINIPKGKTTTPATAAATTSGTSKAQTSTAKPQTPAAKTTSAAKTQTPAAKTQTPATKPQTPAAKPQTTSAKTPIPTAKPETPSTSKSQTTAKKPQAQIKPKTSVAASSETSKSQAQKKVETPATSETSSDEEPEVRANFSKNLVIRMPNLSSAEIEKAISKISITADILDTIDLTEKQSDNRKKIQIKFDKKDVQNTIDSTESPRDKVVKQNVTNISGNKPQELTTSKSDPQNKPKLNLLKTKGNLMYPPKEGATKEVIVASIDLREPTEPSDSGKQTDQPADDEIQIVNTKSIMKSCQVLLPKLSLGDVNKFIRKETEKQNIQTESETKTKKIANKEHTKDKIVQLDSNKQSLLKKSQDVTEKEKAKSDRNKEVATDNKNVKGPIQKQNLSTESAGKHEKLTSDAISKNKGKSVASESKDKTEKPASNETVKDTKLQRQKPDASKESTLDKSQDAKDKSKVTADTENIKTDKQNIPSGSESKNKKPADKNPKTDEVLKEDLQKQDESKETTSKKSQEKKDKSNVTANTENIKTDKQNVPSGSESKNKKPADEDHKTDEVSKVDLQKQDENKESTLKKSQDAQEKSNEKPMSEINQNLTTDNENVQCVIEKQNVPTELKDQNEKEAGDIHIKAQNEEVIEKLIETIKSEVKKELDADNENIKGAAEKQSVNVPTTKSETNSEKPAKIEKIEEAAVISDPIKEEKIILKSNKLESTIKDEDDKNTKSDTIIKNKELLFKDDGDDDDDDDAPFSLW